MHLLAMQPTRVSYRLLALRARLLTRTKTLLFISAIAFVMDQKRRSRHAALRYKSLYASWSKGETAVKFLQHLQTTLKDLLAKHDPIKLHARLNVSNVDLAIAGGGFKALYALGAYFVLQHAGFQMDRMSGASAGSYLASLLVGNRYQVDDLLQENLLGWSDCVVQVVKECKTICLGKIWKYMSAELTKRLNGFLPKPGALFVSVTTLGRSGLVENVASQYKSAEDLEHTICASMSVPFILCDGPFTYWHGQCAVDGGFKNNCPISIFTDMFKPTSPEEKQQVDKNSDLKTKSSSDHQVKVSRVIIKVDGNKIARMPNWRKIVHVAYAPGEACGKMILEGAKDMLEVLSSGKKQVNGITVIRPQFSMPKREHSYQMFPGREHVRRLSSGKTLF